MKLKALLGSGTKLMGFNLDSFAISVKTTCSSVGCRSELPPEDRLRYV